MCDLVRVGVAFFGESVPLVVGFELSDAYDKPAVTLFPTAFFFFN